MSSRPSVGAGAGDGIRHMVLAAAVVVAREGGRKSVAWRGREGARQDGREGGRG